MPLITCRLYVFLTCKVHSLDVHHGAIWARNYISRTMLVSQMCTFDQTIIESREYGINLRSLD